MIPYNRAETCRGPYGSGPDSLPSSASKRKMKGRCMNVRQARPTNDIQESPPSAPIRLSRAGVTRSAKRVRLRTGAEEHHIRAEIACFSDLAATRKGAHMSRFDEQMNAAIEEIVERGGLDIAELATQIAVRVADAQDARRGEGWITADHPVTRRTPASGLQTQELYELTGVAVAGPDGVRTAVGVTVQGMNACPCAQDLMREQAETALRDDGFGGDDIARILARVPIATHNQRAKGTLIIGGPAPVALDTMIDIVEDSMSSEIYELLKRTDERYVVDRAHRRPRFVEDSVREMVLGVVRRLPELPDATFLRAHQANFETIHAHDVEAERSGLLGDVRRELMGVDEDAPQISLAEWLAAGPGPGGRS